MAKYKDIGGTTVGFRSGSEEYTYPSGFEGSIYYNSSNGKFEFVGLGSGSWSSGGNLNTKRMAAGGAGTQTAGAIFCGDADGGICVNGVGKNYTVETTVAWSAAAQAVQFSVSNDAAAGDNLDSSSVTINDLPTMSNNLVDRVGDDFIIKITAVDINSAAGDTLTVNALVEHSSSPYEMSFVDPHYEVTIAESDIINEIMVA